MESSCLVYALCSRAALLARQGNYNKETVVVKSGRWAVARGEHGRAVGRIWVVLVWKSVETL